MKIKHVKGMKIALALTVAISTLVLPTTSQASAQSKPVATQSSAKTETMPKGFNDISLGLKTTTKGKKTYNTEFNKIVKNAKKKKTTFDKIYYVHNAVSEKVDTLSPLESGKLEVRSTAYGALVNKKADPHGFTHLMYLLLNKLNIENDVINANPFVWNLVKVGKNYYHVDTFYDNYYSSTGSFNHTYFMLSDKKRFEMLPIKWTSKKKAKDAKYDSFAKTYNNLKFTDKGFYYAIEDDKGTAISYMTLAGKKTTIYKLKENEKALAQNKGWLFMIENYLKEVKLPNNAGSMSQRYNKVTRLSYDGKKRETLYDGKSSGAKLKGSVISIQGDTKGKVEIDILKLKY